MTELQKNLFVPFSKVDAARREVSGIVTAELPDKDHEVCDYDKSKPYYQAWSDEFKKATDGSSLGNLREMHGLNAAGKAIGIEFNDTDKEITMTFKVIDDAAWKKVDERVYTGFSQGGRKVGEQVPDPLHKGCMRYVANPSEVSLVDNPCLGAAHFAYVKSDGTVEMRKFLKTEVPPDISRIAALEEEVSLLKAAAAPAPAAASIVLNKEKKTKRVAGKDLSASDFAYVGDAEKTETWKFPIHDASHARNALARFNQAKGIPASEKSKVRAKIVAAARKFGVDVAQENEKRAAILGLMRKAARIYINENFGEVASRRVALLDSEIGKGLNKGMYEVSSLACSIETLSRLVYCLCCEQEFEGDEDSKTPEMLAENVMELTETLIEMVDEEARELIEGMKSRVA